MTIQNWVIYQKSPTDMNDLYTVLSNVSNVNLKKKALKTARDVIFFLYVHSLYPLPSERNSLHHFWWGLPPFFPVSVKGHEAFFLEPEFPCFRLLSWQFLRVNCVLHQVAIVDFQPSSLPKLQLWRWIRVTFQHPGPTACPLLWCFHTASTVSRWDLTTWPLWLDLSL